MTQTTSPSPQKTASESAKPQKSATTEIGQGLDVGNAPTYQSLRAARYSPSDMLWLQRSIGNRAVAKLLGRDAQSSSQPTSHGTLIQAKLTVGPADDQFEDEAEDISSQVMRMSDVSPRPTRTQDEEETAQRTPAISQIQRRAPVGLAGGAVDSDLERNIHQAKNGGSSLSSNLRSTLEPKLNADLSGVKVHTDSKSVQLNRDLGAKAFTHKNHIFYGAGQSPNNLKLTTHEAVHTIQQGAVAQRSVQRTHNRDEPRDGAPVVGQGVAVKHIGRKVADTVQRSVGFEFQTTWGIVKNEPDPNYVAPPPLTTGQKVGKFFSGVGKTIAKPFKAVGKAISDKINPPAPAQQRQGPIPPEPGRMHTRFPKAHNHIDDGHIKLSTDDASTPLGSEIEWVIDPPIPDNATPEELETVITKLSLYIGHLLALQNQDSFRLSAITGNQAHDEVEIQPAAKSNAGRAMDVSPQATGGIKFEHMFDMLKDVAERKDGTTDFNSGVGQGRADNMTKSVLAANIDGSPQLKGLLAFIYNYMTMNKSLGPNMNTYKYAADYAKVNTQFLLRTDFATMFGLLPHEERQKYAKVGTANPDTFVNLVKTVMPGIDMNGQVFERGIKNTANQTIKYFPLTRKQWIQGIAEGEDKLSGASQYAKQQGYAGELESMGNINDKAGKLDQVGRESSTAKTGIIMEFRSKTDQIKAADIPAYIRTTFNYIQTLNARKTEQEKVQEQRLKDDSHKARAINYWG